MENKPRKWSNSYNRVDILERTTYKQQKIANKH